MMWLQKQGIVAKISGDSCIILTPEGTYDRISLPSPETRVGAEVSYRHTRFSSPVKPWLMAASLLILFMGYTMLHQSILPQAAAYVSLDINHSLEMAVDKHMRVIDVQCYDDEAATLVEQLSLKGKGLNEAITAVVNQAIEQNYITAGQNNLMISTVSPSGTAPDIVDQDELYQVLENSMASRGYPGQVKIYAVSTDFRTAAENKKLSAGKYLIYEQLIKSGNNVSIEDINRQKVGQLADTYQLDLLPNYKKITLQTASANQDPEIAVEENGQSVAIGDYVKSHRSVGVGGAVEKQLPDTNVSRSYQGSKSRATVQSPRASVTTNPAAPEQTKIKGDMENKAIAITKSTASKIKSEIKKAKAYGSRPLF